MAPQHGSSQNKKTCPRSKNAFTSSSDILHGFIGFIACLVNRIPYGWIISFLITLVFVIYEAKQPESPRESYHDLIEFTVGWILGFPFLKI